MRGEKKPGNLCVLGASTPSKTLVRLHVSLQNLGQTVTFEARRCENLIRTKGFRIRGALLGASGSLGPLLGRSLAAPGPSRDVPGPSWAAPVSLWGRSGWLLGLSWAGPGPLLTSWTVLGASWASPGPPLGALGPLLAAKCDALRNLVKKSVFHVFSAPGALPGPPGGLLAAPGAF